MSPSSRYTTERVCSRMAAASDATKNSSSPTPNSTGDPCRATTTFSGSSARSEEHTSELQSLAYLVCRLLLEKKKKKKRRRRHIDPTPRKEEITRGDHVAV